MATVIHSISEIFEIFTNLVGPADSFSLQYRFRVLFRRGTVVNRAWPNLVMESA